MADRLGEEQHHRFFNQMKVQLLIQTDPLMRAEVQIYHSSVSRKVQVPEFYLKFKRLQERFTNEKGTRLKRQTN